VASKQPVSEGDVGSCSRYRYRLGTFTHPVAVQNYISRFQLFIDVSGTGLAVKEELEKSVVHQFSCQVFCIILKNGKCKPENGGCLSLNVFLPTFRLQ
jgi:hypothetical protein